MYKTETKIQLYGYLSNVGMKPLGLHRMEEKRYNNTRANWEALQRRQFGITISFLATQRLPRYRFRGRRIHVLQEALKKGREIKERLGCTC